MWQYISDGAIIVGGAVLRSIAGWAVKALEDNKIEDFEIKQLIKTVVSVGSLSFIAYLGYGALSMENAAILGMASGYLGDKVLSLAKHFIEAHKGK